MIYIKKSIYISTFAFSSTPGHLAKKSKIQLKKNPSVGTTAVEKRRRILENVKESSKHPWAR
jgi:hypothetical protein